MRTIEMERELAADLLDGVRTCGDQPSAGGHIDCYCSLTAYRIEHLCTHDRLLGQHRLV